MIMNRFVCSICTLVLSLSCLAQGHYAGFNSSENIAPAVSELISIYYDKYVADVLHKTKEKNREEAHRNLTSVENDFGRFVALPSEMLCEINRFVVTSLEGSEENVPDTGGEILFFIPSSAQTSDSSLLFLFVQGQCVGVGSVRNGLVAVLSYASCDPSAFYDVVVLASEDVSKTAVREVFSSSVMFKLKKEYVFGINWKKKMIDNLFLK